MARHSNGVRWEDVYQHGSNSVIFSHWYSRSGSGDHTMFERKVLNYILCMSNSENADPQKFGRTAQQQLCVHPNCSRTVSWKKQRRSMVPLPERQTVQDMQVHLENILSNYCSEHVEQAKRRHWLEMDMGGMSCKECGAVCLDRSSDGVYMVCPQCASIVVECNVSFNVPSWSNDLPANLPKTGQHCLFDLLVETSAEFFDESDLGHRMAQLRHGCVENLRLWANCKQGLQHEEQCFPRCSHTRQVTHIATHAIELSDDMICGAPATHATTGAHKTFACEFHKQKDMEPIDYLARSSPLASDCALLCAAIMWAHFHLQAPTEMAFYCTECKCHHTRRRHLCQAAQGRNKWRHCTSHASAWTLHLEHMQDLLGSSSAHSDAFCTSCKLVINVESKHHQGVQRLLCCSPQLRRTCVQDYRIHKKRLLEVTPFKVLPNDTLCVYMPPMLAEAPFYVRVHDVPSKERTQLCGLVESTLAIQAPTTFAPAVTISVSTAFANALITNSKRSISNRSDVQFHVHISTAAPNQ